MPSRAGALGKNGRPAAVPSGHGVPVVAVVDVVVVFVVVLVVVVGAVVVVG